MGMRMKGARGRLGQACWKGDERERERGREYEMESSGVRLVWRDLRSLGAKLLQK